VALHDLTGVQTEKVAQITGEDSENKTQSRFGVWGTDLGSFTRLNGKTYLFGATPSPTRTRMAGAATCCS
jgi:hypothetical protein